MMTIETLRETQLSRLVRHIRRNGKIRQRDAVSVMTCGRFDRRDARFHLETVQGFVDAGHLTMSWDDEGYPYIGVN